MEHFPGKCITLFLLTFLVFSFCIPSVLPDGVLVTNTDERNWTNQPEKYQLAAIHYENGYENLLISVSASGEVYGNTTIWIFPIPASPDQITIDVFDHFPYISGIPFGDRYKQSLDRMSSSISFFGTFPLSMPLMLGEYFNPFWFSKSMDGVKGGMPDSDDESVMVHDYIEKYGIRTELVTANNSRTFREYLMHKGLQLPVESYNSLNEYIGKDYSFVISSIKNTKVTSHQILNGDIERPLQYRPPIFGVFVKFPTDRIFFPLKPTSIYSGLNIPLFLYVIGHVSPGVYPDIAPYSEISYYEYYTPYMENLSSFLHTGSVNNLDYTRIKILAPSEKFTRDLWVENSEPRSLQIQKSVIASPITWGSVLFLLISVIASIAAGKICYHAHPISWKTLGINGLWNSLTMIGFAYGTFQRLPVHADEEGNKKYYFGIFYLIFLLITAMIPVILAPAYPHDIPGMVLHFLDIVSAVPGACVSIIGYFIEHEPILIIIPVIFIFWIYFRLFRR